MKIIFIDTVHKNLSQYLTAAGFQCDHLEKSSKNEIENMIHKYDALVVRSRFPIDARFLKKATKLKCIARSGSGIENIDLEYCKKHNITCIHGPEANSNAVAEHVMGMIISLLRKLHTANEEIQKDIWKREENRGEEIFGKTIGIIGYGNTGSKLAEKLVAWNCEVLVYDPYKKDFATTYILESSLAEIKNKAQIISFHVPYNKETHHYLDREFIDDMKNPFYVINTSRGAVIDTKALLYGLESGKIKGAGLDVFEVEASSFELRKESEFWNDFNKIRSLSNVIMSPHIAGWTFESFENLGIILAKKIIQTLKPGAVEIN